jgi:hypothetical protein
VNFHHQVTAHAEHTTKKTPCRAYVRQGDLFHGSSPGGENYAPHSNALFIKIALEDIKLFLDCGGELVAELCVELLNAGNFVLPEVFVNVED